MKKPAPKGNTNNKGQSSSPWTEKTVGKAVDLAKEGMSTVGSLVDFGKEVQRTKQAGINAQVKITEAVEKTNRTRIDAGAKVAAIARDLEKNRLDHEAEMKRLQNQQDNDIALIRQRDRVLDKLLDSQDADASRLTEGLRGLLPNGNQQ